MMHYFAWLWEYREFCGRANCPAEGSLLLHMRCRCSQSVTKLLLGAQWLGRSLEMGLSGLPSDCLLPNLCMWAHVNNARVELDFFLTDCSSRRKPSYRKPETCFCSTLAGGCQERVSSATQTDHKEIAGPHKGTTLSFDCQLAQFSWSLDFTAPSLSLISKTIGRWGEEEERSIQRHMLAGIR